MSEPWTTGQDEILAYEGFRGVDACVDEIRERFGIERTRAAVKMRASKIGASLMRYETCPRCGRKVKRLKYSGLCDLCHERELLDPKSKRKRLMREMRLTDKEREAVKAAKRERVAENQRRHREKLT